MNKPSHSNSTPHKPDVRKANPCPPLPPHSTWWDRLIYTLGIGLGSGLPQRAAGTWGTVGGLIIALPLMLLGFIPFLIIIIISCLIGSYICGKTSELMNVHDDPHIVFDEWVGMWISLIPVSYVYKHLPLTILQQGWGLIIVSFILFRIFDIIKPFPINWVDRHAQGGFGILIDDILAGIMAMIILIIYLNYSH